MTSIDWPWAIVLCRFSDLPDVPQPREYYVDLYTQSGAGGIADYWRAVSSNAIDITGSKVFGWLEMKRPSSDVSQLVLPRGRGQLAQWGRDTAADNGVDLKPFRRVLVVYNFGTDHGAAGNDVVIVHSNPALCEFGFICHEMGHGFGLPHSFAANPDREYGDGWDVMSFPTTTFDFPITFRGTSGEATVGLNARNLEALGATPPGRTWRRSAPDFSASLTLDPLNQPPLGSHGYLVARISRGDTTYTAEYRRKAGWDQGIPEDAVSVREIRANGLSYLYPSAWARLTAGQRFVISDPGIYIQPTAMASTASLRIWDLPNGSVRKEDSKPEVYLVEKGRKRWVTSPAVLSALGKTWDDVRSVPDGALASVSDGPNVDLIKVTVTPYPVPLDQRVSVTVQATDMPSGTPVQGNVEVDGEVVGTTGTAFSHTFRIKRTLIPGTHPREFDRSYPQGVVHVPSYPDAKVDFGFTDF